MRRISDLEPFLPFEAAGLTVEWDDSIQADTAAAKTGAFNTLANTPAVQNMTKMYLPKDIISLLEKLPRDYDPELVEWEGSFQDALKPRGGRNPFHLLEQVLKMGPTGDANKRGPAPIPWPVFYRAMDRVYKEYSDIRGLTAKHIAIGTPKSSSRVLKFAHVLQNSSGEPYVSDPKTVKTAKKYHVSKALDYAAGFTRTGNDSLPLWPSLVFARGDRAADYELYLDNESARSKAVFSKRDRKIDAQSFNLQILDGIFTQALADTISQGPYPDVDLREPHRLSNHFVEGLATVQRHGQDAFSIGGDESAWDQNVTPQGWYATFLFYRKVFAPRQSILHFDYDGSLVIRDEDLTQFNDLAADMSRVVQLTSNDKGIEKKVDVTVTRLEFETEPILRRLFAGVSGTPVRMGNLMIRGLQHVLDTPEDGKILLGWSQRSGNFCTFLSNCMINIHKLIAIEFGSRDVETRAAFKAMHGYEPPEMEIVWKVVRGDDSGSVWLIKDTTKEWKISELFADWIAFYGGNANAKKQDTSDERGRWRIGFAQKFSSENFPRGVSSGIRVAERNIWNEADEVITVDPDSGEDLRDVLQVMNTYGRVNNLWGVWDSEVHPIAEEITALLQDLDELRMLPPLTDEERRRAGLAYALKLFRRGQISSSAIDDTIRHFWTTDLAQFAKQRYENTPRLKGTWYPLTRYGEDSRPIWRAA